MDIRIHIHHHSDPTVEDMFMAVSQAIADLLAQVKLNTSIEASADLAMKALSQQIMDLGTQIAALQLQLANGGTLHPDDLAALSSAQADLAQSAARLQTDIPANTTPVPTPAPVVTPDQDPLPLDMNGNPPFSPNVNVNTTTPFFTGTTVGTTFLPADNGTTLFQNQNPNPNFGTGTTLPPASGTTIFP